MHLIEDLVSDWFESILWHSMYLFNEQVKYDLGSFPSWLRRLTVNKLALLPQVRVLPAQAFGCHI